jgi:ribonucleotide reductase class II
LLARFSANATFPRLPFEPISKEECISLQNKVIERKVNNDFFDALNKYDVGELSEAGPAGCDSDKCLLPLAKPKD